MRPARRTLLAGAARVREAFIRDVEATDLDAAPADLPQGPRPAYQLADCRAVLLHVIEELAQKWGELLDHGRIVERGTHDELLAAHGLYASLYTTQFEGEGDPVEVG